MLVKKKRKAEHWATFSMIAKKHNKQSYRPIYLTILPHFWCLVKSCCRYQARRCLLLWTRQPLQEQLDFDININKIPNIKESRKGKRNRNPIALKSATRLKGSILSFITTKAFTVLHTVIKHMSKYSATGFPQGNILLMQWRKLFFLCPQTLKFLPSFTVSSCQLTQNIMEYITGVTNKCT